MASPLGDGAVVMRVMLMVRVPSSLARGGAATDRLGRSICHLRSGELSPFHAQGIERKIGELVKFGLPSPIDQSSQKQCQ